MIWYPYQQMKTMKAPYEIVKAEGPYLYTKDAKLLDSISSWWSVIGQGNRFLPDLTAEKLFALFA